MLQHDDIFSVVVKKQKERIVINYCLVTLERAHFYSLLFGNPLNPLTKVDESLLKVLNKSIRNEYLLKFSNQTKQFFSTEEYLSFINLLIAKYLLLIILYTSNNSQLKNEKSLKTISDGL